MHVEEELPLPIRHSPPDYQIRRKDEMPVPVVSIEPVVLPPVGELSLRAAPEPAEVDVVVKNNGIRLLNT